MKFLPEDSTLFKWYSTNLEYFPEEGFRGDIYFAENDLRTLLPKLRHLSSAMQKEADEYLVDFDPWYPGFEKYLLDNYVRSIDEIDNASEDFFNEKLTQYLFSPSGGKYRHHFKFENHTQLKCGQIAPKVIVSTYFK